MRANKSRTYEVINQGNLQADTCKFFNGNTCTIIKPNCDLICNSKKCTLWLPHNTAIDFIEED